MYHNIKLEVADNYDNMSQKAAEIFASAVRNNPQGAFGFATGSTPVGMYKELINMNLDFSGITTFNLDEYYPIEKESDQSYYHFMQKNLFGHVNVDSSRTFFLDGKASDPTVEAQQYEQKITDLIGTNGIIMQILGIGLNGHIGFNEPCESFEANTRLVPLAETTIEANSRFFASAAEVPKSAITMGIRSIMLARNILLLANGSTKAGILRDALSGPVTPLVPASILQLHPSVTVVADKEAASLLTQAG